MPPGISAAPIASITALPLAPGDITVLSYGHLVLDRQGNAVVGWGSPSAIKAFRFDLGVGWGPAVTLDGQTSAGPALFVDADQSVFAVWDVSPGGALAVRSNVGGSNWTVVGPTPAPLLTESAAVGGHGRVAALVRETTDFGNPQMIPGAMMMAKVFDPGTGWSASPILSQASAQSPLASGPFGQTITVASDGTVLATWLESQPSVQDQTKFAAYTSANGWTAPAMWDGCTYAKLVPQSDGSIVALCPGMSSPTAQSKRAPRFAHGAWTAGNSYTAPMLAGAPAATAARRDSFFWTWVDQKDGGQTVHALYGAGSSMQRVDLGVRPYLVLALRAGMDDMGRVVVVWTESVPKEEIAGMQGWMRGSVQHLFYARYTPGVGWTSPVQIDGDDGKSLGATAVDFAVNDTGLAMLLWVGGPIVGNGNNLWVASLP